VCFKYFVSASNFFLYSIVLIEITSSFAFFYYPPFPGSLLPHDFSNSLGGYVVLISRMIYPFLIVGYASMHTTVHGVGLGVYHWVFGIFGISNYLNHLLVFKQSRKLRTSTVFNYNQISLLLAQFNDLFSYNVFIKTITPGLFVPVSCLFVVLKYHGQLHVFSTLILLILALFIYVCLEFIFIMASSVWLRSGKVLQKFNTNLMEEKRKAYFLRILKSQRCLKIKIGENNFVEASTPMSFASYNLTQLSTLLCANF